MGGDHAARRFFIRRAFRIYPLSIVAVLIVWLLNVPPEPRFPYLTPSIRELTTNLLLIQNLIPSRNLLGVLWSLPWEVQMYLALPFVHRCLRPRSSILTPVCILVGTAILRLWGLSLGIRWLTILQYVPCFMAGAVAYRFSQTIAPRIRAAWWPLGVLAIICFGLGLLQSVASGASYHRVSLAWYGCSAITGLAIPWFSEMRSSGFTRAAHVVAKYSYGIYLAHVPLMWFSFVKLSGEPPAVRWLCLLCTSAVVPVLLFYLVEQPMIRVGRYLSRPRLAYVAIRRTG